MIGKSISDKGKPLVSCIMPTYNRRIFVSQAIKYFMRQDYPNKELVVVDDGEDKVRDLIPSDKKIRFIELSVRTTTGQKRNIAISESKGEIIAHWDDDDWYAETRLSSQVEPLLHGEADLTGLDIWVVSDLHNGQFGFLDKELHSRLFVFDIGGGTLVYRKQLWANLAKFHSLNCGEDPRFLEEVSQRGAIILKLCNCGNYIYIRHNANVSPFAYGQYTASIRWKKIKWQKIDLPYFFVPREDRIFYDQLMRHIQSHG